MRERQPIGEDGVRRGIENQTDVCSRNTEVGIGAVGEAIAPIDHAVALRIKRRLQN